jgi:hypothetical protein
MLAKETRLSFFRKWRKKSFGCYRTWVVRASAMMQTAPGRAAIATWSRRMKTFHCCTETKLQSRFSHNGKVKQSIPAAHSVAKNHTKGCYSC